MRWPIARAQLQRTYILVAYIHTYTDQRIIMIIIPL